MKSIGIEIYMCVCIDVGKFSRHDWTGQKLCDSPIERLLKRRYQFSSGGWMDGCTGEGQQPAMS